MLDVISEMLSGMDKRRLMLVYHFVRNLYLATDLNETDNKKRHLIE